MNGTDNKGQVVVISGYPAIGKSYAAREFKSDPLVEIVDLDSGKFKKDLGKEAARYWVPCYIAKIKALIAEYEAAILTHSYEDSQPLNAAILVSAHEEVRAALDAVQIPFYYVAPRPEALPVLIKRAENRANDTKRFYQIEEIDANLRALEFLRSVDPTTLNLGNITEYPMQTIVQLTITGARAEYLSDFIVNIFDRQSRGISAKSYRKLQNYLFNQIAEAYLGPKHYTHKRRKRKMKKTAAKFALTPGGDIVAFVPGDVVFDVTDVRDMLYHTNIPNHLAADIAYYNFPGVFISTQTLDMLVEKVGPSILSDILGDVEPIRQMLDSADKEQTSDDSE